VTAPARVKQSEYTRIFRAAKAAAYPVVVKVEPNGSVVILPFSPKDAPDANPWDLPDDEA
jgi:hypothetical protein